MYSSLKPLNDECLNVFYPNVLDLDLIYDYLMAHETNWWRWLKNVRWKTAKDRESWWLAKLLIKWWCNLMCWWKMWCQAIEIIRQDSFSL